MRQKRARVDRESNDFAAGKKRIILCNCNDPGQKLWLSMTGIGIDYGYFFRGKYDADCPVCGSPYWYTI